MLKCTINRSECQELFWEKNNSVERPLHEMKPVFTRVRDKNPVIKPLCVHLDIGLYPAWGLTSFLDQFENLPKKET